ncbi:DUF1003 domain-containing protein [Auraticoccus monumenti]|uniref:DUF1003 domain-containing protein n=1 Tax=Auraticoccus monumenti TaxID=675864 RepID=A0A1G7BZG7_9ACTN|nr:DUF1003 domain-containing protein [Auraticoccus monumenti]SDE32494.1 Protein of unknown function [Auraticoccus monumenti]
MPVVLSRGDRAALAYADALLGLLDHDDARSAALHSTRSTAWKQLGHQQTREITALVLELTLREESSSRAGPSRDDQPAVFGPLGASHLGWGDDGGAAVACPECGHALSMFIEPEEGRADRLAGRIAGGMGTWYFVLLLLISTTLYLGLTLSLTRSSTSEMVALNHFGLALAILTAVQTPLILLTQRRDAARDRERDREALRIAANTETDLHAIRASLTRLEDEPRRP